MTKKGYKQSQADHFVHKCESSAIAAIIMHVDDFVVTENDPHEVEHLKDISVKSLKSKTLGSFNIFWVSK